MPTKLTTEILNAAIEGFETQKRRIDTQIAEIRQILQGARTEPAAVSEPPKPKRRLSAAGRRRIIEATKKRWAAIHAAKQAEQPAPAKKTTVKKSLRKKAAAKAPRKVAKKAAKAPKAAPVTATAE